MLLKILTAPFRAIWAFFEAVEEARSMQNEYYKKNGGSW